jgi:SpoVK/Ycf46/Vps4 family AAA+-type ATPase
MKGFSQLPRALERARELVDTVEPSKSAVDLVLSPDVERQLYDIVEEYRHGDSIRRHNIPLRTKLLFCGPPGCGKSITAEVLAREVGLPLLVAKLDTLVGSLLGETASNLRRIFDAAEHQNVVLFLDEFDAIARSRADAGEHGEMRRVVNNLLLMIDRFKGRGFIVAATNLAATIDQAVVRRFDEVVEFPLPSPAEIRRMIRLKTTNFLAEIDVNAYAKSLSGRSFADIEGICYSAIRRAIMNRRKSISEADFSYAVASSERRLLAGTSTRITP